MLDVGCWMLLSRCAVPMTGAPGKNISAINNSIAAASGQ